MTAGQVAEGLDCKDITINYRASEAMFAKLYPEGNPFPRIEYLRYNCDFQAMRRQNPIYATEEMFPKGVNFLEPGAPADYKREILQAYPESYRQGVDRGLSLVELLNKRVLDESEGGEKRVCYLIVCHAVSIETMAYLSSFMGTDPSVPATAYAGLSAA